jgi:DNA repair exonuclease SbcCD ATPase subunit
LIVFKTIRWKNFLSTGNVFTEVDLNTHKTTLVTGQNGAGKSTILDAMCFALFDKPFRKISKTKLINSVNGGDTVVEFEFDADKRSYKVVRGIKPNLLEIYQNGVLMNQESVMKEDQRYLEEHILKMSHKAFTQIDILGSARFTPFMQLSAADRRSVIEDLLDIGVFSIMNTLAKARKKELEETIYKGKADLKASISVIRQLDDTIQKLEKTSDDVVKGYNDELTEIEKEIAKLQKEANVVDAKIEDWHKKGINQDTQRELNDLVEKYNSASRKQGIVNEKIKIEKLSFDHYNTDELKCDSCGQEIDKSIKDSKIKSIASKIVELTEEKKGIEETLGELKKQIQEKQGYQTAYTLDVREQSRINTDLGLVNKRRDSIRNKITNYKSSDTMIADSKKKKEDMLSQMKMIAKVIEDSEAENDTVSLALTLLKDSGIKAMLIKQYLPVINKKVNEFLKEMDFFVRFELDENFSESIKSRHLDTFSYENFSEGEKMRIDLALLFTWRHIARMRKFSVFQFACTG